MKEITRDLYSEVALALGTAIGSADFFNGSVDVSSGGTDATLILTAIIHRRTVTAPDGERRPVSNVVPVWWEFRTFRDGMLELNDFDFGELKRYLIEND